MSNKKPSARLATSTFDIRYSPLLFLLPPFVLFVLFVVQAVCVDWE